MNYLDVGTLFDGAPAHIALLSTFQFDPTYFEKRLLRAPALNGARRIVIFMDAGQWFDLIRQDVPSRGLNRRYLVVPVYRSTGVFHPKLSLLVSEKGGLVHCGSNNLTRSGCSSNLELLNVFPFDLDGEDSEEVLLAKEAFQFFCRASEDTDEEVGRIVREWLDETAASFPWLTSARNPHVERRVRLVHTYDGGIWERLVEVLGDTSPKRFVVLSPFHDKDGKMLHRVRKQWPRCSVEFVVQQGYTNLPIAEVAKLRAGVELSEVENQTRRLHAKLVVWEATHEQGCVVGSANFTVAAFDGRNVEVCLLVSDADGLVASLFDKDLSKRNLAISDFQPGTEGEPDQEKSEREAAMISSAVLLESGELRVKYGHNLDEEPIALRVAVRGYGEQRERASVKVPKLKRSTETVTLPEKVLTDLNGTLLASLIVEVAAGRTESSPVWVIQEDRLTYEAGEGSSSTQRRIEETGEGLAAFLDVLGRREGMVAVIEYLRNTSIRFYDGAAGARGKRRFRLVMRDPFQPDAVPDWIINDRTNSDGPESAILEFVDRHDKRRLRKHVSRGNVNGMQNFVDIFTTLIELLYKWYVWGTVQRGRLIGRMTDLVEIATSGKNDENDPTDGYLLSVHENLGGDHVVMQEACEETNFLAHIRAALLIVQMVRFVPNEKPLYGPAPQRPKDVLRRWAELVRETFSTVGVEEPGREDVQSALEQYRMFTEEQIAALLDEL